MGNHVAYGIRHKITKKPWSTTGGKNCWSSVGAAKNSWNHEYSQRTPRVRGEDYNNTVACRLMKDGAIPKKIGKGVHLFDNQDAYEIVNLEPPGVLHELHKQMADFIREVAKGDTEFTDMAKNLIEKIGDTL